MVPECLESPLIVALFQNASLDESVQNAEASLAFDEIRILREMVYQEIDHDVRRKQTPGKVRGLLIPLCKISFSISFV